METTIGVDFYLSEIDVSGKKIKVGAIETDTAKKIASK